MASLIECSGVKSSLKSETAERNEFSWILSRKWAYISSIFLCGLYIFCLTESNMTDKCATMACKQKSLLEPESFHLARCLPLP